MAQDALPRSPATLRVPEFQHVLWVVYGAALLLLALDWLYTLLFPHPPGQDEPASLHSVSVLVGILLAFIALDLLQARPHPPLFDVPLLLFRILIIELYSLIHFPLSTPTLLYLLLPFIAYPYLQRRHQHGLLTFIFFRLMLASAAELLLLPNSEEQIDILGSTLMTLFMVLLIAALIAAVDREKHQRLMSERLSEELETLHAHIVTLAMTEERNRLARDIHDSLGHYLTIISVQLDKALILRDQQPETSREAVLMAKRLTREALGDVRASVAALRAPQVAFHLETRLRQLVADTASPQLSITLEVEGISSHFSEHALMTLYRVVQEGMTNIQKHARAARAHIHLTFSPEHARLMLRDDGVGFDTAGRALGFGLIGIRERVEQLGGALEIKSHTGGGTCLSVTLPANPLRAQRLAAAK